MFVTLGTRVWGTYGFANAFNLDRDWFAEEVIGIDLGMALLAIENSRSGLIWRLMHASQIVERGMAAAGFRTTDEPEPRAIFRRDESAP
jgi:hypothetical protein